MRGPWRAVAVAVAVAVKGARRLGAAGQLLPEESLCAQGLCDSDCEELCLDRCTLDGRRPNPCPYECEPLTKTCYDECEMKLFDVTVEQDKDNYDHVCVGRAATKKARILMEAAAEKGDLTLRLPPASLSGLDGAPWPLFRGNLRRDGKSPARGPKFAEILWQFQAEGPVTASPVVCSAGHVYVASRDGHLYALLADGTLKWKYPVGAGAVGSVAVGNRLGIDYTVYVVGGAGRLHAVSATHGTDRLQFLRGSPLFGPAAGGAPPEGVFASPTIGPEGTVYVSVQDNALHALAAATGGGGSALSVKWSFFAGGPIQSSAALVLAEDPQPPYHAAEPPYALAVAPHGALVFGAGDNYVYAVASATGALLWRYRTNGAVVGTPAVGADDTVYVGSRDGGCYALDGRTGAPKWRYRTRGPVDASPALDAGDERVLFVSGDGHVYCIGTEDGRLRWKFFLGEALAVEAPGAAPGAPEGYRSAAAYREAQAWEVLHLGEACEPGRPARTQDEKAMRLGYHRRQACGEAARGGPLASPLVADGYLYVGAPGGAFYALGVEDGGVLWRLDLDGAVLSSAAMGADGTLYVGTERGTVYSVVDSFRAR